MIKDIEIDDIKKEKSEPKTIKKRKKKRFLFLIFENKLIK
jgi:hypothetical protein